MTLNQIINEALQQDGRNTDAQTVQKFRNRFKRFANDALVDLGMALRQHRTDSAAISGGYLDTHSLPYKCVRVLSVIQSGTSYAFTRGRATDEILVTGAADGPANVQYLYLPKLMSNGTDVPDIPEYLHGMIVLYLGARIMVEGDSETQRRAATYMQMYEDGKRKAVRDLGEQDSFEIINKWS